MNEFDYVLLFIISVGVLIGLVRGFIRVLISIVGIHFTVLVLGYSYKPIGGTMAAAFNLGYVMMYNFAYIVLLVAMTVVVEVISRAAFEQTQIPTLRKLDNLIGGIVGILYGALWASLFLVPIQYGISNSGGTWMDAIFRSELVPTVNNVFHTVVLNPVSLLFIYGTPAMFDNWVVSQLTAELPLILTSLGSLFL